MYICIGLTNWICWEATVFESVRVNDLKCMCKCLCSVNEWKQAFADWYFIWIVRGAVVDHQMEMNVCLCVCVLPHYFYLAPLDTAVCHCSVACHYHLLRIADAYASMDGYTVFDMLVELCWLKLFPNSINTSTSTVHQSESMNDNSEEEEEEKTSWEPNDISMSIPVICA